MTRLISSVASRVPRDGPCLEIGVGTGRIALPLAREGVPMVGVDISREMLKRLLLNARGAQVSIAVADATRLPFGDGTFASAIAAHVFHLIPAWKSAIAELLRVLRPTGVLFASRGGRLKSPWGRAVRSRFFLEAGNPPWPPGADTIEEVDEHMRSVGAAVDELIELSDEGSMSINEVLTDLEAGHWSACWSLDAATRTRAAAATRDWARVEIGDLDEKRTTWDTSTWHAYLLDAG